MEKWNHEFIDLPEDKNPKQPSLTGDVVTDVIALAKKKQHRMFFVLCASAGLRHGEALGIDIKSISQDCSTVKINQKAWRGQLHDFLKTESSKREIDLHPSVAAMLKDFLGETRRDGLLLASSVLTGTFAAHDCASVSNNVTDSRVLGLALGACANDIVPTPAKKVVRIIFEIRIINCSPKEREDGKAEPNWPRWTAESPV